MFLGDTDDGVDVETGKRVLITQTLIRFIARAEEKLSERKDFYGIREYLYRYKYLLHERIDSVEEARDLILRLEEILPKPFDKRKLEPQYSDELHPDYPVYSELDEIIPIYDEAVSIETHKPIVIPSQIPNLLCFLQISGFRNGVDIENHGFGYHFHYGKVKSNRLIRTNLLFTFDPLFKDISKNASLNNRQMYYEYHADGKNVSIDVDTIGAKKRRPIYYVCHDAAQKKGFSNFKRISNKSGIFYPFTLGSSTQGEPKVD